MNGVHWSEESILQVGGTRSIVGVSLETLLLALWEILLED